MMRTRKGFTLTEILTVVIVLAVLAAIVLPRFSRQDERAVVSEAIGMMSAIRQAEAAYALENPSSPQGYESTLGNLDVDITASTRFTYSVDSVTGAITATRVQGEETQCPQTGANAYGGCTIILTADGVWDQSATHPFKPA